MINHKSTTVQCSVSVSYTEIQGPVLGKLNTLKADGDFLIVRITSNNNPVEIYFYAPGKSFMIESQLKDARSCSVQIDWYEDVLDLFDIVPQHVLNCKPRNLGLWLEQVSIYDVEGGRLVMFYARYTDIPEYTSEDNIRETTVNEK